MIFSKKFTVFFVVFLFSFFVSFAETGHDDDIFKNQKIIEGDFYNIVLEPSKAELQNENSKFFQELKQKKLEILLRLESSRKNLSSSKKNVTALKEKQQEILRKNKTSVKKSPEKKEKKNPSQTPEPKTPPASIKKTEKKLPVQAEENLNKETESINTSTIEQTEKQLDDSINSRKKFIDCGMDFKGIDYVWGGKSPSPGFDCSGFVIYTAKKSLNMDIKGNAQDIYNQTEPVPLSEALPGDLIFFKGNSDSRITHVGIYLGKNPGENDFGKQNLFLNAASAGPRTGVIISGLNENYWKKTYYSCGRLLPAV